MTLIIGLKSKNCVVIGSEQEESGGITAKSVVTKLKLITGKNWAVVVGGAGDAAIAERGMRDMKQKLSACKSLTEQALVDITDEVLDSIHTKYIDKDRSNEGVAFVIGASCRDGLHLISTEKRVPQVQESRAYAGFGADIGIYFLDRLHQEDADWVYCVNVAGFTLQQAIEACRYCSGEAQIYALQRAPNPRWRSLGGVDSPLEFKNEFQAASVGEYLEKLVRKIGSLEGIAGYRDEHHPNEITMDESMERMEKAMRLASLKPKGSQ